jgi:hypothetical protein
MKCLTWLRQAFGKSHRGKLCYTLARSQKHQADLGLEVLEATRKQDHYQIQYWKKGAYVDLDLSPIFTKGPLFLRADILVTEKHNRPLSNQQSELIFLLVCEVFQLETDDLGSNVLGQMNNLRSGTKQSFFLLVCFSTPLNINPA